MMTKMFAWLWVIGLAAAAVAETAGVETAGVDTRLTAHTFQDQHGEEHTLDDSVRIVVFTRDMDAGNLVKAALAETSGEDLTRSGVAYLADISAMPKLAARLFALPAMRRRPYAMWLDRDGTKTAELPSEDGRVTLLKLDRLEVRSVSFVDSENGLREALGLAPASDD